MIRAAAESHVVIMKNDVGGRITQNPEGGIALNIEPDGPLAAACTPGLLVFLFCVFFFLVSIRERQARERENGAQQQEQCGRSLGRSPSSPESPSASSSSSASARRGEKRFGLRRAGRVFRFIPLNLESRCAPSFLLLHSHVAPRPLSISPFLFCFTADAPDEVTVAGISRIFGISRKRRSLEKDDDFAKAKRIKETY